MSKGLKKTFSDKQLEKMRWLWQNTSLRKADIADKLGLSKHIVIRWTKGLKVNSGIQKRPRMKNNKLMYKKPKLFSEMMRLWKTTSMGKKTIAKKIGLSESACMKYLKNIPYNEGIVKDDGRWEKGHESWNKGLIGLTSANKTSFKKGQKPFTLKYDYGEPQIVNRPSRGCKEVWTRIPEKILIENHRDGRVSNTEKRVLYSRYLWQKHYGDIPKGMVIYHLDGDPLNNDLSNLKLISRATLARLNQKKYYESENELRSQLRKEGGM